MKKYIAISEQRGFNGWLARLNENGNYVEIASGLWGEMMDLADLLNDTTSAAQLAPIIDQYGHMPPKDPDAPGFALSYPDGRPTKYLTWNEATTLIAEAVQ